MSNETGIMSRYTAKEQEQWTDIYLRYLYSYIDGGKWNEREASIASENATKAMKKIKEIHE